MSDVPVQLIVAAFQDEGAAKEVLKALKALKREKLIGIQNAAVLRKNEKGKIYIKETADMGGGKGSVIGGVAGAAIGLIAGPALVVPAAVGALVGGLSAKLRDFGFSNKRLQALGEGLQPGTSAIVAVVEHKWVAQVEAALAEAGRGCDHRQPASRHRRPTGGRPRRGLQRPGHPARAIRQSCGRG